MDRHRSQRVGLVPPLIGLATLLAGWQAADAIFGFDPIILPNPVEVASALKTHFPNLCYHAAITFAEALAGFVLAAAGSAVVAAAATFSRRAGEVLIPFAVAVKATPVIVLAPLLVMWLGNGYGSKVVMAALACFFPILVNTYLGMASVEGEWVALMRLHRASAWQVFWHLRLPHSLPNLFAGLRVATSLSMVGAVVSEFSGAERGIGKLVSTATFYLNTDLVFAGVLILSAVGVLFYAAVSWAHRLVVFWESPR